MRAFFLMFALLAVLATGFVAASVYFYRTPSVVAATTVVLPPHTGAWAVLTQLHEAGVAPSPWLTAPPVFLSGTSRRLKAGEYAFTTGMTPAEILGKIARGEVVTEGDRFGLRIVELAGGEAPVEEPRRKAGGNGGQ